MPVPHRQLFQTSVRCFADLVKRIVRKTIILGVLQFRLDLETLEQPAAASVFDWCQGGRLALIKDDLVEVLCHLAVESHVPVKELMLCTKVFPEHVAQCFDMLEFLPAFNN